MDKNIQTFEKQLKTAQIRLNCDRCKRISVFLDGKDITKKIRENKVSSTVPFLAQLQFVQDKVRKVQHDYAKNESLVVEGRETTSIAFPNADYKFYFDADINIRANRRLRELQNKGENISFEEVKEQLVMRDRLDIERELAPLIKVADAIEIDASRLPNEVVDEMLSFIIK